ncbi:hypothetical protein GOODEAATRI_011794 [Goodea atripinnis]|uniref:Stereocilin LRR domain-containing protein n=1 Tax=Goodea atripinnis TaxID=208336 RepID=A0ABV0N0V0_9TELE
MIEGSLRFEACSGGVFLSMLHPLWPLPFFPLHLAHNLFSSAAITQLVSFLMGDLSDFFTVTTDSMTTGSLAGGEGTTSPLFPHKLTRGSVMAFSFTHAVSLNNKVFNLCVLKASIIVDKLFQTNTLSTGQLQQLGTLIVGVKTETLLNLTSDKLLSAAKALTPHLPVRSLPYIDAHCPLEANTIATKLWGFQEVVNWLDDVKPLLKCTPLLSVLRRTRLLVEKLSNTSTKPWNTQQVPQSYH